MVQYFSGQTDVQPDACGSFVRMDDDDSRMAGLCHEWGADDWHAQHTMFKIGKWGPPAQGQRSTDHTAFVTRLFRWMLRPQDSRFECDDSDVGVSSGDFWKVFVR